MVAMPLLVPFFVVCAVHWKTMLAPYLNAQGTSVGISSSDRGVNFHRRASEPTARIAGGYGEENVEMSVSTYVEDSAEDGSPFSLSIHKGGRIRFLSIDAATPRNGVLVNLTKSDDDNMLRLQAEASGRWKVVGTNLYLSCFGGPPTEGALFTLLGREHASGFSINRSGNIMVSAIDTQGQTMLTTNRHFIKFAANTSSSQASAMAICGVAKRGQNIEAFPFTKI